MVGTSSNGDAPWHGDAADRTRVFDLLAHEYRRHAIAYLATCEEPVPVTELAAEVATRTAGRPRTAIPTREIRTKTIELHHNHVPKLADAGVVEYDRECSLVELSGSDALVRGALSLIEAEGDA